MPNRTPVGKRIRTIDMGYIGTVLNGVTQDIVAAYHQWEEDVRVIGVGIGAEAEILDASSNTDGEFNMITEVTRAGARSQPGSLMRQEIHGTWNAAIYIGGASRLWTCTFFPEGYGYDFETSDYINLLAFMVYIGGVASIPMYPEATIYYVER